MLEYQPAKTCLNRHLYYQCYIERRNLMSYPVTNYSIISNEPKSRHHHFRSQWQMHKNLWASLTNILSHTLPSTRRCYPMKVTIYVYINEKNHFSTISKTMQHSLAWTWIHTIKVYVNWFIKATTKGDKDWFAISYSQFYMTFLK